MLSTDSIDNRCISDALIPVECFLHRIFPVEFYSNKYEEIIHKRAFKPRRDSETQFLTFPIDWEAKSYQEDRNYRMQLQGWAMFHPVMNFFDDYPNKSEILDYFFDVMCDWASNYQDDPDDVVTTRMPDSYAWYDMSVGFRALIIAYFLGRIEHFDLEVSAKHQDMLEALSHKHINNLSNEKTFSLNNHGMFQIQGLMGLIQHYGIEHHQTAYAYALDKMEALVLSQFDIRGVHLEHSPHYHFYSLSTFEAIAKSQWYNSKPAIVETIDKAVQTKKWIVDPLKRPACVGDSILTVQNNIDFSDEQASEGEYIQSEFDASGYAIIRSNWNQNPDYATYLFFMGAYHAKTHKHRDCLSFEWFDNGKKIICDSGKYGYKSDKYRHYFLSNKAHNTVEIEGFDILKTRPYESAIKETKQLDNNSFLINAALEYPAIHFDRTLYLRAHKWIIIRDKLAFKRKRGATQWFHLDKGYDTLISSRNNRLCFEDEKGKRSLIFHCLNESAKTVLHRGDEDNMQGFLSEKDYEFSSAYAVGFDFHTDKEEVITVLALKPEYEQEALKYASEHLGIQSGFCADTVIANTQPLIKSTPHAIAVGVEGLEVQPNKNTYSVVENNWALHFYADIKESKKLVVMLPGATDRSKKLISLQRSSWSDDFEESVISFADPTVAEHNDISIGWFQGKKENYAFDHLVQTIRAIIKQLNIKEKDVSIFGSSAGGFVALQLGGVFPQATTISINPQIYLYNYQKAHFNKIMTYSYPNMTRAEIVKKYPERITLTVDFDKREAPSIIYQNTADVHHMHKHLQPFLKGLDEHQYSEQQSDDFDGNPAGNLNVIYYEDKASGHSPPDKEATISFIRLCPKLSG